MAKTKLFDIQKIKSEFAIKINTKTEAALYRPDSFCLCHTPIY